MELSVEPLTRSLRDPYTRAGDKFALQAFFSGFGIAEPLRSTLVRRYRLGRSSAEGLALARKAASLWFAQMLGLSPTRGDVALALGRLAWLETDASRRWPEAFLAPTVPAELVQELKKVAPALPPPVLAAAMPEARLAPPTRLPVLSIDTP
jgi:hypothetical protein